MLIGLTGSPGCGKSAALETFSSLGWFALDADAICKELYSIPGGALPSLFEARWGRSALNGAGLPDKGRISSIVFNDDTERAWLDSVVHPEIKRAALEAFEKSGAANGMLEAALIFEAAWTGLFKFVVSVWCEPSIQLARLRAKGWDDGTISRRIAAQMPSAEKLELADFGIVNNSSLGALREQCAAISELILNSK